MTLRKKKMKLQTRINKSVLVKNRKEPIPSAGQLQLLTMYEGLRIGDLSRATSNTDAISMG